jgi:hypothetical protein
LGGSEIPRLTRLASSLGFLLPSLTPPGSSLVFLVSTLGAKLRFLGPTLTSLLGSNLGFLIAKLTPLASNLGFLTSLLSLSLICPHNIRLRHTSLNRLAGKKRPSLFRLNVGDDADEKRFIASTPVDAFQPFVRGAASPVPQQSPPVRRRRRRPPADALRVLLPRAPVEDVAALVAEAAAADTVGNGDRRTSPDQLVRKLRPPAAQGPRGQVSRPQVQLPRRRLDLHQGHRL